MKIKISLLLICFLLLCGCSSTALGGNTLLRPPRATGDKAEIQDIIAAQAGGKYTFKYPQNGDNRSAIMMRQDKGNHEYAVALYSPDNDTKINVSIISCIKEQWKCIGTFQNTGSGVDRVIFADLNMDGTEEIIIGWSNYSNAQKTLTAYSVSDQAYEIAIEDTYDEMTIADMTADNSRDMILLSLGTQKDPPCIKVLQYSEKEKKPIARYAMELDPGVISFANITVGNIAQGQRGIVIDGEKSGGLLTSQVIYLDEEHNTLVNPLVTEDANPTARKDTIYSRDADKDAIIEVPVVTPLPAAEKENAANVCSITAWKQYSVSNAALGTKLNTVINYNDRYYFAMPNRWMNNAVTAVADPDTRQMTFYAWDSQKQAVGQKLLTIFRYTSEEWEQIDYQQLIPLEIEGQNAVFCARIFAAADEQLQIKEKEVIASARTFWTN